MYNFVDLMNVCDLDDVVHLGTACLSLSHISVPLLNEYQQRQMRLIVAPGMIFFNESCFCIYQDQYNNLPVDLKVTQLLAAIHAATLEEQARSMAAVILRRLFAAEFQEFYTAVSATCTSCCCCCCRSVCVGVSHNHAVD